MQFLFMTGSLKSLLADPSTQLQLLTPKSCARTPCMKTFTEFTAFWLRDAHSKSKEIHSSLGTEGKTAEELAAAHQESLNTYLTEKYKLEGDRLGLFTQAVTLVSAKPKELENLKRVVVYSVAEGEKVPSQVRVEGSFGMIAEYLPPVRGNKPQDRRQAGGKPGKGDKKGKKKGRGRRRPDGAPERRGANTPKGDRAKPSPAILSG